MMPRKSIVMIAALALGIGATGYSVFDAGDKGDAFSPDFSVTAVTTQDDAASSDRGPDGLIDPEVLSQDAGGAV